MTARVVALPGVPVAPTVTGAAPAQAVIERLERLLDDARQGKIRAFAYAFVDRQGATFNGWASQMDEPNGPHLVAAVVTLQHEIVAEWSADADKPEPT